MANLNLNQVILGGRLTADPELKQTANGISVTSFSIAINRRNAKDGDPQAQTADFINCVAWRNTADFICNYFRKGSSICVTGAIQVRQFTDQQGQKRYVTEVLVNEAMFVDSKNEVAQAPATPAADPYAAGANFTPVGDDDDLPF